MPKIDDDAEDAAEYQKFYHGVGQRIQAIREQRGLSRRQLTESANIKPTYGYLIEGEGQNITLRTLCKIAEALGANPRDLIPTNSKTGDVENEYREMTEQLGQFLGALEKAEPFQKTLKKLVDKRSPAKRS